MTIGVFYTQVTRVTTAASASPDSYAMASRRFRNSYLEFNAGEPHVLHVIQCGGPDPEGVFEGMPNEVHRHHYYGQGKDIGAFINAAAMVDYDWMVCFAAHTYFHRAGWLKRLVEAIGPEIASSAGGLYGAMASLQIAPHIRTSSFMTKPQLLRNFPYAVRSPENSSPAEAGPFSLTNWIESLCLPVRMVTWTGVHDKSEWRCHENIFRRGDQSNCLVWDRHTDIYSKLQLPEKRIAEMQADGI